MKFLRQWGRVRITLTSLSAERAADKLARAGVAVSAVKREGKNGLSFEVARKDCEKVFAILRGSCYNIVEVRARGLVSVYKKCLAHIGLLAGALLFALCVTGFQSRVLRIEVVGSGAYYEREVRAVLSEKGIKPLSALPRNFTPCTAEILSLPNVSFCEMRASGGVLTVEVWVSDERSPLAGTALLSPAAGKIEELVVLRGTPCAAAGEEVEEGQVLVRPFAVYGEEEREVVVIARVTVSYPVSAEYGGTEEEARAQALLDFGGDSELEFTPTEQGYSVTGRAFRSAALNFY